MLTTNQCIERSRRARTHILRLCWPVIVFACAVASCGGEEEGTGPVIHQVTPAAATPGATVEILGERFCGDGDAANDDGSCIVPPTGLIGFGVAGEAIRALDIQSWRHERIEVAVPGTAQPGATVIVVTVNGVPSNEYAFEVQ